MKRDLWPPSCSAIVMPWNVMLWHHAKIPSIILPLLRLSLFFCIIHVPFIKRNDWKTFPWMLVYIISKVDVFILFGLSILFPLICCNIEIRFCQFATIAFPFSFISSWNYKIPQRTLLQLWVYKNYWILATILRKTLLK